MFVIGTASASSEGCRSHGIRKSKYKAEQEHESSATQCKSPRIGGYSHSNIFVKATGILYSHKDRTMLQLSSNYPSLDRLLRIMTSKQK